jgi:hypothetical protein
MIQQDPADPVWLVTLQVAHSMRPSQVLGADGKPAADVLSLHPESEITVHAPDAATASAYVVQQNPGAQIKSATKKAERR